jgi:pimeloyl-ACP methyl ester carboxylesterase
MSDPMTTPPGPTPGGPDTVVLIHGLWMTPLSWQPWVERFENVGWTVLTPTWPGMDRPIETLRADTASYAKVGVSEVTDHHAAIIKALPRPPIIIGHSFGGGVTQLLLDQGLGAVGVAISPAPVKGVLRLPISSLRSALPVLHNPRNYSRAVALTNKQFHHGFATSLTAEASDEVMARLAIPAPGRPLFQAAAANFIRRSALKIDRNRASRAPLLLIAASLDRIAPPSLIKAINKVYHHSPSTTEYQEFTGRSHIICSEPGWEEIADTALRWAATNS